ncbi:MAG: DUF547 domain-containing protein [Desulfomonilia bacterium]|nr:DUF547 domain-containing protein [Desulfomonilia bacterium]
MSRIFSDNVLKARKILDENWTGTFTKPAPSLYPHQWNWDSGFIAIGLSRYAPARAMKELDALFAVQWANGMLPQIVFNERELGHYFPEPDFWQTERSSNAPRHVLTSGITMPPIHAVAVEEIYVNARSPLKIVPFLKKMYPRLLSLHNFLYRERDPMDEGLVYIRHPWESGIDNSPSWDAILGRMHVDRATLPAYERKDLAHAVDASMRPSDEDYDRYVFLVELFKRNEYDEARIRHECPFLVQDPLFNSILCRANESLVRIASILGEPEDLPASWLEKTSARIKNKLWDPARGIFNAYDLVAEQLIEIDTAAGFLPLYAGAATRDQAEILYKRLNSSSFCALHQGNCFTIPNYDTHKDDFDRSNYWRGPVWININWMLAHGLRRYGYTLKADSLQKDLLQLPIRFGFHEYFDSFDGTGYGSDRFSWTAALFIDLVYRFYEAPVIWKSTGRRITGLFSADMILNTGNEMPQCTNDQIASELMGSIKDLREKFYDTNRGRVDYAGIKGSPEYQQYRILTNGLRTYDLTRLTGRREKLAFWINLYNTIVVDAIISLGIENSVKEHPGFFRDVKYQIGPHFFSADDMEHGILRGNAKPFMYPLKQFSPLDARRRLVLSVVDPRIHFALVCGSRSCAPIEYYDKELIYDQLELAAKSFVNSSEVIVLPEDSTVLLSEIFRWYERDFGGVDGIVDFVFDYLVDDTLSTFIRSNSSALKIDYLHYDWNLNR